MLVDPLQESRQIVRHQQLHLLFSIDIEYRSDEIGELHGLSSINEQIHHVFRNSLQMLNSGADQFLDITQQCGDFWRVFLGLRQRRHRDAEIGCGRDLLLQCHAFDTL